MPALVHGEWWRGSSNIREQILAAVVVEEMPPSLCRAAGEALGAVNGSTIADAIVMASAALPGGGVYTSDVDGLKQATAASLPDRVDPARAVTSLVLTSVAGW